MQYRACEEVLLLRPRASSFMDRGPEFSFLAAFSAEAEFVFPPCTYLAPTGRAQTLRVDDATSPAIDVQLRWVYFET